MARRKSEESHGWQNRKVNVPIFGFAKNGAPAINDTDEVSAIIVFYDGHTEDVTDDQEFTSGDTSIATVGCTYCGTVQVTAKGVGTTQIEASAYYQGYNGTVHVCPGDCPQVYVDFTVSAPVLPVIDGIETSARLWFFGTGNSESGYNTSTTLTADTESFTDGSYQWTVTTGSSIVQFSNNSSTITVTDATTTALNSKSYSVNANDVTVTLLYTTPDTSLQTTVTLQLDVDSPYQFSSAGANQDYGVAYATDPCPTQHVTSGTNGYVTFVLYNILSRFGATITNADGYEVFPSPSNPSGVNWELPTAGPFTSASGQFADCILGNGDPFASPPTSPTTLPPQSPRLTTIVRQFEQDWYIGSTGPTPHPGVLTWTDQFTNYQDHGNHLDGTKGR